MTILYSPRVRIEKIIIICRIILATFSLLAIWLDPLEPYNAAIAAKKILSAYFGYALLLWPLLQLFPLQVEKVGLITHIADILIFTFLVFITQSTSISPFFSYFIFALLCAALRWQKNGTLWTALAFLCLLTFTSISSEIIHSNREFQLNHFIIRNVYLVTIALLLVYLTAYEQRIRDEIDGLANWPHKTGSFGNPETFIKDTLAYAAQVVNAPRVLVIWEEAEEPIRHIVHLSPNGFSWRQMSPDAFDPPIAAHLDQRHFLCKTAADPEARVLRTTGKRLEYVFGAPLHPELTENYNINRVIGLYLDGQKFQGRLLFLDKAVMIPDELTLGILAAQQLTAQMDQLFMRLHLQQEAVAEERIKVSRDLHDGLLQTLTGIALQVKTISNLSDKDLPAAQQRLGELQDIIVEEQRGLRNFIQKLKPVTTSDKNTGASLNERLIKLADAIKQQWQLDVTISLSPSSRTLPQPMPEEIFLLVREALINSARHAQATQANAAVSIVADRIHIDIADNGHGFPLRGQYDLGALLAFQIGPKSIMERIGDLQGTLCLDSSSSGSRLEITLPLFSDNTERDLALVLHPETLAEQRL